VGRELAALLLLCMLPACASSRPPIRYVPAEEAAWFKFDGHLPEQGRQELPAAMASAIQLAMEHFRPWNARPPRGASRTDLCLLQRQSWDVEAAPGPEGVVLVRFTLHPGACRRWGPLLDAEAFYAVDVRNGRILAVR
jgi:hypothetical protein